MTAIMREHLQAIDGVYGHELMGSLQAYAEEAEAIREPGLRDHAVVLATLGAAGLPRSMPPAHKIGNPAVTFPRVWKEA